MKGTKNYYIKLKKFISKDDFNAINALQKLCLDVDKTTLKLELDYKLGLSEEKNEHLNNINEFMYYDDNKLIGYIGICDFGVDTIEVNGMVHPDYRRKGIFSKLFSLVKNEWSSNRLPKGMLLLSDSESESGIRFINSIGAKHGFSEYTMFLNDDAAKKLKASNVILRKATNEDAREIAKQNSIYFDMEYSESDIILPEEDEKIGIVHYIAEVNNKVVGKVHLAGAGDEAGIYGVGILPEYRGKGYGRELIIRATEILKEEGYKNIMIQVETDNSTALNLYKSSGFEITSKMNYYELSK